MLIVLTVVLFVLAVVASGLALAILSTVIGTNRFKINYEVAMKYGFISGALLSAVILGASAAFIGVSAATTIAEWNLGVTVVYLVAFFAFIYLQPKT